MTEEAVAVGLDHIVTPNEDDFRVLVFRMVPALLVELRGVQDWKVAAHAEGERGSRDHAAIAREEAETHVRRAEARIADQRVLPADVATRADHSADGLRTPVFLNSTNVVNDDVVRLVPADPLPFVLAALADSLYGVLEAIQRFIASLRKV